MPPAPIPPPEPGLRAALEGGIFDPLPADAARLVTYLARAFGPSTVALIHYGSHAQGSGATPESARDFFVIVDDYPRAYRALAASRGGRFPAGAAATLNRLLPPNVVSVTEPEGSSPLTAKCAVLSVLDLRRACAPGARDLWVRVRAFQQVQLAWARDDAGRDAARAALVAMRASTLEWGRYFLPARFDAEGFCRALIAAGYRSEIRPEDPARVDVLVTAQRATLVPVYDALLGARVACGELARDTDGYHDPHPPGAAARLRMRVYLAVNKARATLRWAKYLALYEGWLDYLVQKVERRSGVKVELTPRERRWPLLFLWPKALRYLGARPQRRGPS